jgi:hypothetical protein
MEERFGPFADLLLAREGLLIDPDSRSLLVKAVAHALDAAARKLERNALFDYSPDPTASHFPAWEHPGIGEVQAERITVAGLLERWSAYQADKLAENTVKRYAGSLRSLATFTKSRDIRSLTADDLYAWAE